MKSYPYHIVWDMEALNIPVNDTRNLKIKLTTKHKPISYSVAARVPHVDEIYKVFIDSFERVGEYLKKTYISSSPKELVENLCRDLFSLQLSYSKTSN